MKKILITTALTFLLQGCWQTSNGEKIGTIVKCAKEGMFIKTYECELIRGGMNGGNGSFGTKPFDFTIEDQALFEEAKVAMERQKEIKVHFHNEFATLFRTETGDNSFVDAIEILN